MAGRMERRRHGGKISRARSGKVRNPIYALGFRVEQNK
jgi:hypothetical protein